MSSNHSTGNNSSSSGGGGGSNKKKSNKKKAPQQPSTTAAAAAFAAGETMTNGTTEQQQQQRQRQQQQQQQNNSHTLDIPVVTATTTTATTTATTTTTATVPPPAVTTITELQQFLSQQMVVSSTSNAVTVPAPLSLSSQMRSSQQQKQQQQNHAFWDTQPMRHPITTATTTTTLTTPQQQQQQLPHSLNTNTTATMGNTIETSSVQDHSNNNINTTTTTTIEYEEGPIVPNKDPSEIRSEPYSMPSGFHWSNVNIDGDGNHHHHHPSRSSSSSNNNNNSTNDAATSDAANTNDTNNNNKNNNNSNNNDDIHELYTLLSQNYVEDDDELFRFDYSKDFLLWALRPPEYNPDFIFGVRTVSSSSSTASSTTTTTTTNADGTTTTTNGKNNNNNNNNHHQNKGKLVAFISGIPTTMQIHQNHTVRVVEINFLCVHKKLRSKRLAPVLIKEMTRRVNLTGIFQAVYTAGTILPVPISSARYYHRNLNPKKLVDIQFSRIGQRMTMARMVKLYKLPEVTTCVGLRPMVESDVVSVHTLLNTYLSQFAIKIVFTVDEIRHWLLPRDKVISTYVISNTNNNSINDKGVVVTDMISFYHLPSNILSHVDTKLFAAYSYYNVATTVPYLQLMKDALILAKHTFDCDVYNALNVMDNDPDTILKELKFGIGDGTLQYYIYNWATNQTITSNQLGIVLL